MNILCGEKYLHSLTRFGSQLGLERMTRLLELMGNPQDKLKFIHIAGTNGKGSVANLCANMLQAGGYNVGLYTSPFVNDFRERFQVNGTVMGSRALNKYASEIERYAMKMAKENNMQITEFEAVTAIAFRFFAEENCDIVCLEVGLGGRFDATNVIKAPEIAVITSISKDHGDILGDTIEKIAYEKAGIIKENTTVVCYPLMDEAALAVIRKQCEETNSTLILPESDVRVTSHKIYSTKFSYLDRHYQLELTGMHQIYNAIAAMTAIRELNKKGFHVDDYAIRTSMIKTRISGRFERFCAHNKPVFYLDGAHNLEAINGLCETIKLIDETKKVVVMGMMEDKDYEGSIKAVAGMCDSFIAIPVNNPRAAKPEVLANVAKKYCKDVHICESYDEMVALARKLAGTDGAVIGCGSFYMIGDFKIALVASRGRDS